MMGVGYHTVEKLIYDKEDGAVLTDRSWDYHLGEARDIPQDFCLTLKNNYSTSLIYGSKGKSGSDCESVVHEFVIHFTNICVHKVKNTMN